METNYLPNVHLSASELTASFQWRKLFLMFPSGLGMFFWWFFFFLLPWFPFPVPFHGDILIFPFSNGIFVIFVLFQVAPCGLCIIFLGCQKQCWLSCLSDLGKLSVLYPVVLVSQAGAEVLTPMAPLSLALCSGVRLLVFSLALVVIFRGAWWQHQLLVQVISKCLFT